MVVRIRLQRMGFQRKPIYNMVVSQASAPRDGKCIERVGTYNPHPNKDGVKEVVANMDRIKFWLSRGAQPSERVGWLLGNLKMLPLPPRRYSVESAVPKYLREEKKPAAAAAGGLPQMGKGAEKATPKKK